jgi:hypothetical protein
VGETPYATGVDDGKNFLLKKGEETAQPKPKTLGVGSLLKNALR